MSSIKFSNFRPNKMYRRKSDQAIFKLDDVNKVYFKADANGVWQHTEDLKLSDEFEVFSGMIAVDRFEDLFNKYKSGDIEHRNRYFDLLLLNMAKELDKLREK
jgi:hypothetical protein